MARQTLTSQLYAIKILSSVLPKNWKIYVKEHPDQFKIYYSHKNHLNHIDHFRSMSFYSQIELFKNVKFIKMSTNSKELIKHVKAICYINGSVFLKAILAKKPIIIFGNETNFVRTFKR